MSNKNTQERNEHAVGDRLVRVTKVHKLLAETAPVHTGRLIEAGGILQDLGALVTPSMGFDPFTPVATFAVADDGTCAHANSTVDMVCTLRELMVEAFPDTAETLGLLLLRIQRVAESESRTRAESVVRAAFKNPDAIVVAPGIVSDLQ